LRQRGEPSALFLGAFTQDDQRRYRPHFGMLEQAVRLEDNIYAFLTPEMAGTTEQHFVVVNPPLGAHPVTSRRIRAESRDVDAKGDSNHLPRRNPVGPKEMHASVA